MGYCPFLVLCHGTTDCIVKQQGTGAQECAIGGCDTTAVRVTRPATSHDKAGPLAGQAVARTRAAWLLGCVAIKLFVS